MPSQLYPKAREAFATAQLNWLSEAYGFKAIAFPLSFSPSFAAQYVADLPSALIIRRSEALTGRTATDGMCGADPIVFTPGTDVRQITQIVIYQDTDDDETSLLVAYFAAKSIRGQPLTAVGANLYLYQDASARGFFRL